MAKTVVGLFRSMPEAENVVRDLETQGFSRSDISIMASSERRAGEEHTAGEHSAAASGAAKGAGTGAAVGGGLGLIAGLAALAIPGFGPVIAAGPIVSALTGGAIGAAAGGLIGGLTNMGVSHEDAEYYAEGVRRGGVLVAVKADENRADQVAEIMERYNAEDIEKRSEEWRTSGWTGPATAAATTERRTEERRSERTGERSIPIVEEQMQVGKRQVQRGGVRVYSHMTEHPVEEHVNLREERVNVQRRPADRPATEADIRAFKEGSMELTETAEEPVVSKTARVVEEVVLGKEVEQHDQTIRDTVKKTDVEVERMAAGRERVSTSEYDQDFRGDFATRYANRGYRYEQYAPAYELGSTYASDQRYNDWSTAESYARRDWESRGQGKWEDVKDAVRYGFDRIRGRRR